MKYYDASEIDVGQFFFIQPNSTHQLSDPTLLNPTHNTEWGLRTHPTQPNPTQFIADVYIKIVYMYIGKPTIFRVKCWDFNTGILVTE